MKKLESVLPRCSHQPRLFTSAYVVLLALKIIPWHSFHVFALLSLAFWVD